MKVNGKEVPQGWHEVTYLRYALAMAETDSNAIAAALIGIEADLFEQMHPAQIELIMSRLSFWFEPIPVLTEFEPVDIGKASWEKMNAANDAFKANASNHYLAAIDLVKIYYSHEISDWLVGEALPYVIDLFEQFERFSEQFAGLTSDTPNDTQIAAGIEKIHAFGVFGNLDAIAKGNVLEYDVILQQPAITIYFKMLLDKVKSDYVEEYQRLMAFANKP